MNWEQVFQKVSPYIVRIETPSASGTGFLCFYNHDKSFCGIATALHVVDYANQWKQPIKITHHNSLQNVFLDELNRIIFADWKTDSAVILIKNEGMPFPDNAPKLLPLNNALGIGNDVCWMGFPAIEPFTLCFFSGNISARQEFNKAYLIDGVAINGVSGGPVVYSNSIDGAQIVGIVSSYKANRTTGDALPGLLYARDVSHFHEVINHIRSLDDANKKKHEFEQKLIND
ncbi:MAG: serine protease [Clostridia bacterium]|nr:serine protease [Clostridia bacterium]